MHLNLPRKVHCSQSWPDGCYRTHIATVYYISRPPLSQNPPSALDKLTIKITKIIFNILFSGIRFWKSFPVKFIQLLIFFESTNLCRDKMWKWSLQIYISGTLFMLFAAVLLFIWVILSLWNNTYYSSFGVSFLHLSVPRQIHDTSQAPVVQKVDNAIHWINLYLYWINVTVSACKTSWDWNADKQVCQDIESTSPNCILPNNSVLLRSFLPFFKRN